LLLVGVVFGTPGRAAGGQVLRGHVPAAVARLQPMGRLPGMTNLDLAIGLPLRNKAGLDNLLQQIYDPASPHYRRYLTPEQFAEMFGPTDQDYQALIDFVKANGLMVTGRHPGRALLDVKGSVAAIEKVFHLTMRVYQHPTEARTFYAPEVEPSLDLAVPVLDISGLNNYAVPHPKKLIRKPGSKANNATPNVGSGPGGAYTGYDFRAAYLPGVTNLIGAGQAVGLLEFDGYYANDIATYEQQTGVPSVTLATVLLDGFNGVPTTGINSGNSEVALDIEMTISMAPGLSKVIVYEAGPNGIANDVLSRMASDNQAKQLSCSWSFGVDGPDATADQFFQQMAAQGQSFFDASGDSGAFSGSTSVDFPSDDPYITQVGGTTLTTAGPGGNWMSEIVWNWGYIRHSGYVGSGGGISTSYPIPGWQQGISMSANQGSTTMRNVPDVAMVSDNIAIVADNGQQETDGGTSFAAPLWAGFIALVNQQAAAYGRPPVGLVNPAIYAIGKGANYASDFHDITTGNNTTSSSPTKFFAVTGYDLCTGWGTPNGINLIYALAGTTVPSATFSGRPTTGPAPLTVTFSDSSTGTVTNRFWNFGDGATTNTTATSLLHTYHAEGTNTVTLIVRGPLGASTNTHPNYVVVTAPDTTPPTLTILEPADYQTFTNAGATVTGTSSDASGIASVTVNTNVATLSGTNWSKAITLSLGTNIITVIATDNSANHNTDTQVVHAVLSPVSVAAPVAGFGASPTNGVAPLQVNFTDSSTGTITSRSWNFGDGGTSMAVDPSHTYTNAGTFSVSLSVVGPGGTNTLTSANLITVTVSPVNLPPVITYGPAITNSLLQVGNVAVVVTGETNVFAVIAFDPEGRTLSNQWLFGDGTSSGWSTLGTVLHAYTTNCGPYTARVTVSDEQATTSSNLNVAVACQLTITKLQVKLNFAKPNADSVGLSGTLDVGTNFNVTAKLVTLDIGGAQLAFTLNAKGRGANAFGSCKLAYNKKTKLWTLSAQLAKGFWQTAWATSGLENSTVSKPGVSVTVTVIVIIDTEAFAGERTMLYTATLNKYGSAK